MHFIVDLIRFDLIQFKFNSNSIDHSSGNKERFGWLLTAFTDTFVPRSLPLYHTFHHRPSPTTEFPNIDLVFFFFFSCWNWKSRREPSHRSSHWISKYNTSKSYWDYTHFRTFTHPRLPLPRCCCCCFRCCCFRCIAFPMRRVSRTEQIRTYKRQKQATIQKPNTRRRERPRQRVAWRLHNTERRPRKTPPLLP